MGQAILINDYYHYYYFHHCYLPTNKYLSAYNVSKHSEV